MTEEDSGPSPTPKRRDKGSWLGASTNVLFDVRTLVGVLLALMSASAFAAVRYNSIVTKVQDLEKLTAGLVTRRDLGLSVWHCRTMQDGAWLCSVELPPREGEQK